MGSLPAPPRQIAPAFPHRLLPLPYCFFQLPGFFFFLTTAFTFVTDTQLLLLSLPLGLETQFWGQHIIPPQFCFPASSSDLTQVSGTWYPSYLPLAYILVLCLFIALCRGSQISKQSADRALAPLTPQLEVFVQCSTCTTIHGDPDG